jgi:alkylation response protein AidB-like acyl-CoA dehydrogenase
MTTLDIVDPQPSIEDRDIASEAARLLAASFGAKVLEDEDAFSRGWDKLASAGWLDAALDESLGGGGLSTAALVEIGIAAGKALVHDELVTNAIILPELIVRTDHAAWLEDHAARPGFLVEHPRSFGVHAHWVAYCVEPAAPGRNATLVRFAGLVEFEPIAGLAPGVGQVRPTNKCDTAELDTEGLTAVMKRAELVHSAGLVGIAQYALDVAVDYAKEREQFGKPIGSFQSIKHLLADVHVANLVAETGVLVAARLEDPLSICTARAKAATAADVATRAMVQVLGGIGFTWEHEAHWYMKSALIGATRFQAREEALYEAGLGLLNREEPR